MTEKPCPECGSETTLDLTCHTWPQTTNGKTTWMACYPACDSAVEYYCSSCNWRWIDGLNPNNPRAVANEEKKPPWG